MFAVSFCLAFGVLIRVGLETKFAWRMMIGDGWGQVDGFRTPSGERRRAQKIGGMRAKGEIVQRE